jgi:hypothetical protein
MAKVEMNEILTEWRLLYLEKRLMNMDQQKRGSEYTYESGISILSSARNYWGTVCISDEKIRSC